MKKLAKYALSFLMIISLIVPFIPTNAYAYSNKYKTAFINTTYLSVRSCPSTDTDVCPRLVDGDGDTIWLNYPRVVEVIGNEGYWSKIRFNYWGYTFEGYVYTEYLACIIEYTADQNYYNELINKGFPDTYAEKLSKLHAAHPNWNFEPSFTGITLDEAVEGESIPIYKNLIQTRDTNLLSTDPSAYSNGSFVQFEPGWYAPNNGALSYYLDPRNFLDENSIFMFEQLSYNDSQNEGVVQNILNGSFLAGSYLNGEEEKTFASTFVEAGQRYGVSPVHLAARVLQEQGYEGSMTADMDGGDGKIYHNYFNFGASGSSTEAIYNGALSYAKSSGWDSPYNAIMGATSEIADGYITNNQDTLYYEKFNIVGSSRFWNQYMANIQAPYSEGYTTYRSYWDAHISDLQFTFKIPVYNNMGEYTTIPILSSNANLASLNYSTGSLYPAFDSSITSYILEVSSSTNKVAFTGTTADDKATVNGFDEVTLNDSETTKNIVVKAEDGTELTYSITIRKKNASDETPEDVVNSSGYNVNEDKVSGFNIGVSVDSTINNIKERYPSAEVKMYDSSNNEIANGTLSTGQKISITINGNQKQFDVIIYGDTNGDGKISTIDYSKIKAHIRNTLQLEGVYATAADTSKDGKISTIDYSKVKAHIRDTQRLVQ